MTLHVKDTGGIFREITDLQVRDAAGTLREIQEGWVKDAAGAFRQFYARVINFSPTISARQAGAGNAVDSFAEDFNFDPGTSTADAQAGLWLYCTASDCFVRCGGDAGGNVIADVSWYNPAGVDQGDPGLHTGVGTTIFQLGVRPDSVNIFTSQQTVDIGTCSFPTSIGSAWTDDNKSTFFNPTNDTKYGKFATCGSGVGGGGLDADGGTFELQFTFRKSGYVDYTITFQAQVRSDAESG